MNLYLYDMRENLALRELYWDEEEAGENRVALTRRPARIDLSYMVTCWAGGIKQQNWLLWRVLETFFRFSPLPDDLLQGDLRQTLHPIRTQVAQPEGVLNNLSDFWAALQHPLHPSINLVVTLDLDLKQVEQPKLVFAQLLKLGQQVIHQDDNGRRTPLRSLGDSWEVAPVRLGIIVRTSAGALVGDAKVQLFTAGTEGQEAQVGPDGLTHSGGCYVFDGVPVGQYRLAITHGGRTHEQPLTIVAPEPGKQPPDLTQDIVVEVSMP